MRFLLLLASIALAVPAWAADGDPCGSDQWTPGKTGALVRPLWCRILVDDETSASSAVPVIFDLRDAPGDGAADILSFQLGTDNDCSGGTVEFTSSEVSGGQEHDLADPNPTLSLSGLVTTRINVDVKQTGIGQFINTTWSGVSGCTGGFDVLLVGYGVKR